MKKLYILFLLVTMFAANSSAQLGTDFWFAPPNVSIYHDPTPNPPWLGGRPIYLFISASNLPATVRIYIPATMAFDTTINLAANTSKRVVLNSHEAQLETKPVDQILNTGLRITSNNPVTAYYEIANSLNNEIFALKGANALGTEFYIPMHKTAAFYNQDFANVPLDRAIASFDIVATQNGTIVSIYSPVPVDGHPANTQFSHTLNMGQTYSCAFTGTNYTNPANHPAGAIVIANKPIAITYKDDSDHDLPATCFDLIGDQIVPVEICGTEYIAVKGSLNNGNSESVIITSTQNNTKVYLAGNATPSATLFAGETYQIVIDSLLNTSTNNALYIKLSKPAYATHITGYGCELGSAILPPLNCAGSRRTSFVRSSNEEFDITLLVHTTAIANFTVTGFNAPTLNPASFKVVPGTGGLWSAAKYVYIAGSAVPAVDSTYTIANSTDLFAMGLINGGATTGCRYGYFSEFVAKIIVNAGNDTTVCGNKTVPLNGSITGGGTTGIWTTSGDGTFIPDATTLNATYIPGSADTALAFINLFLTSTSPCSPVKDTLKVSFLDAPWVDAGTDISVCRNNPTVSLHAHIARATGAVWSGGAGTFTPNNTNLTASYTPTAGELAGASLTLTLTTTGNGTCDAVADTVVLIFTNSPVVNAGVNQSVCANNPTAALNGTITGATGGIWSGGTGSFVPGNTALLASYTPSPADIAAGTVTLTLTSTGNGGCTAVTDQMTITITNAPVANAGIDKTVCANNANVTLAGSVTGATGGVWSGGLGVFTPNSTTLNAVYSPTATEILNGTVTLTLTTSGNGNCNAVTDQMSIIIGPPPTANAGVDQSVCFNNPNVTLNGSVVGATGGQWSGGGGTYNPNINTLNAVYTPSAAERTAGTVTLTLTSTGNGLCSPVTDQMTVSITPAPVVNAGIDRTVCANNSNVTLAGSVTGATGGQWSGGTGSYNPGSTALNAIYTPSAAEITAGTVTLTLSSTGNGNCNPVTDQIIITITPAPVVNAGLDRTVCANNANVTLAGSVTGATGGVWSGGLGTFNPNSTTLNAIYTPSAAERTAGTVTLTLTSTGNGLCNAVSDQMIITITAAPTVNAGVDQSVCTNNPATSLSGTVVGATGGIWSGGTGTYSPNNTSLITVYTPSAAERTAGTATLTLTSSGNGLCSPVTDQIVITITAAPIVNAGIDRTVCANNANVTLAGSVTGATGGQWSGGTGSYNPGSTALNAVYSPSAAEITAGTVTLTLTSTGNGNCNPVTDQIIITITPAPVVNAGLDRTVCANNANVTLAGSVTGAAGGVWSGGLGTFNPNSATLNAIYTPSAAERTAGTVTLTLTSTGNGLCNAVSDQMIITITTAPTANAGPDQSVCANNSATTLTGTVVGATGGAWSGGTGTYNPNNTTLNTVYTPSAAERTAGTVTLTLSSTGNGLCSAVTDQITITITSAPVANAGIDRTVCANNANVTLAGSVTGATGGQWSGGTGSYNPSSTALNAIYTPSGAEITAGSVTLTLTSTGNGNCNPVTDQIIITITPAPIVNAGLDRTVCANNANVTLAGSVTGAAGGVWSGGLGTFNPNSTTLNAVYTPSAAERTAGTVTLTLTSTGNGLCNAVSDQMIITISTAPTVNAGVDQTVCANNSAATLTGTVVGAIGGTWTGGTGTYNPNNTTLNTVYTPSAAERTAGTVTLTLTSTGNGLCSPVTDQIIITITPAPVVNAGVDKSVCANNPATTINATITGATGGQWSGGTGAYNPGNTALSIIYTPSPAEIAAGTVTLTLTSTGNGNCLAVSDQVIISITPAPIVNAGIDKVVCGNNPAVALNGSVTGATGGVWSGGLGTFTPDNTTLNATYTPSAGEVASGTATLTLTSTGNGTCNAVTDQINITITSSPTANAGSDITVGANNPAASLNGTVTIATGGTWSGGLGSYNPNANTLNAVYTPTAGEIAAGGLDLTLTSTGNGSCSPVSDMVHIFITAAPVVGAGPDQSSCANNPNITLAGTVSGATGGIWSGGTGTFTPSNTTLNAQYTPSGVEIAAGTVTLTLTSTGNGPCNPVTDQMVITITPAPVSNAGIDQIKCSNNGNTLLAGSVTGATGGQWSGGLGLFSPSNSSLNATYTPTAGDIAAGSVILILTTTGNGTCNPVSDQMTISFTPPPTASAGTDMTVCGNNPNSSLNGSVTVATGGNWSGGLGTYNPNSSTLNAVYTPTAGEIASGTVNLVLTTTGNGSCSAVSDNITITINPAPIVNAGSNLNSCVNNPSVTLNGSVLNAGGGQWSGGGGSYNPGNTTLNAVYTPSAFEVSIGTIVLTLTSTGNGSCLAVSDQMTINIGPTPIVNAGSDQVMCANNTNISLSGSVSGATGGQWSGGLGIFSPSNTALNAVYSPTMGEIASGTLSLTLTSTGNGNCNPVSDNMNITFTPAPTASAGPDQVVCGNTPSVTLAGSVTISSGGIWTGGNGTYSPNNTTLNASYTPSAAEIALGTATLTLTSTGNGTCIPVSDQMTIVIEKAPIANAGLDLTSCANNPTVTLNGNIMYATGGIWSGGAGTFNPTASTLNAAYTPSAAEIAAGTLTLTLTSTGNGSCLAATDNVSINIIAAPVVSASNDQSVCGNNPTVTLNGSVSGASGGIWSGGLGIFNPNSSVLNATYTPTMAEVTAGSLTLTLSSTGNGSCNAVSDQMVINYTSSPVANAGVNQTVCANNPGITLSGSVAIASGGIWSGGLGTYVPNNTTLNAIYTPTASEILDGAVDLTLTTTGNGNCNSVSDQVHFVITPAPTIAAGPDVITCVDNLNVVLNGYVAGVTTTGQWSTSGTGIFVPNNATLNATYIASSADSLAQNVTLTLTSTGNGNCLPVSDNLTISILPSGFANAGVDQSACGNNPNILLNGSVSGGASTGIWSTNGSGIFVPSNTVLNAVYIPSSGDTAIGSVTITLTANSCNLIQDQLILTITDAPYVDAGSDITVCVDHLDITLNGTVAGASSTGIWSSSGTGTFNPSNSDLSATYQASSLDSINGGVVLILTATNIGLCNPVNDTLVIDILPPGIVSAGFDQTYCANNATIQLNGSITGGASQGIWATSGSGTFVPSDTVLNPIYVPSSADTATGSVTLALTATNSCNFAMDLLQINFTPAPWVSAGPDQSVCKNNSAVSLNGIVTVALGGIWTSSGTGSFTPNNTSLTATYNPSLADLALGSVSLFLTSSGNGGCSAVMDTTHIIFTPSPSVNAGIDQQVCSSGGQTVLHGIISGGATTGFWTTSGTGTFVTDSSDLHADYIFSSADTLSGSVTLTLTSTNNGTCLAVTNDMTIIFGNTAFVSAGPDITTCENDLSIGLSGVVSGGATTGIWSTTGTGSFVPNDAALNAIYLCSSSDSILGNVQIFLESTNNGGCLAGHDTMSIFIEHIPDLSAGPDKYVCIGNAYASLSGSASNVIGVQWTTNGTGSFVPDDTTLNALYYPSVNDSLNGTVQLTLTSTGNLACITASDVMVVHFTEPPYANAGSDISVCENNLSLLLNGAITGGTSTGIWSSSGTGTFIPGNTTLNATYICSSVDSALGGVILSLTSTNNSGCTPAKDSITVSIEQIPQITAGTDQSLCIGISYVTLAGTASNTGGVLWSTSGSGNFIPDNTTLNALYFPSMADSLSGSVQLTLASTGQIACNVASDIVTINFTSPSTTEAGPDIFVCVSSMESPLTGTVTGGLGTGIWTTSGTGTFDPSASTLNATYEPSAVDSILGSVILTLTSTNNGGCTPSVDSLVYTIANLPVVDAGGSMNICSGTDSISLNGSVSGGIGGTWATLGSGTFSPDNTVLNAIYILSPADILAGSVSLVLTSTPLSGCSTVSDTMVVTLFTPLQVNFTYTTACQNLGIDFADNSIVNTGSITSWLWDFGMGNTADTADTSFVFTTTGVHNVTLTVSSSLGCDFSITKPVYVNPVPVAGFSYSTECYLDSVHFTDQSVISAGTVTGWIWNFGDGNSSNLANPMNQFLVPDTFNVSLVATSDSGCTATDTLGVIINPLPSASFTYLYSCSSQNVTFTSTSAASNDTINFWYWTFSSSQTSTVENPVINYPVTGTYPVTFVAGSSANCRDTLTADVNVYGVQADFTFENACIGSPVVFTDISNQTGGTVISWYWDFGDGGNNDQQNPSHLFKDDIEYTVTLSVQTDSGCVDTITHVVNIYPSPVSNFTFSATDFIVGSPIVFTNTSTGETEWSWSFGDSIGSSSMENPSYIYGTSGTFPVSLVVTNEYNCTDSASQDITIMGSEDAYGPVLPTGFTPNGDGENDTLFVRGGPFKTLGFRVFNEWGRLIFESSDASIGWDGKYKGADQPVGVYLWTIDAETIAGKKYKKTGNITLIR